MKRLVNSPKKFIQVLYKKAAENFEASISEIINTAGAQSSIRDRPMYMLSAKSFLINFFILLNWPVNYQILACLLIILLS